MTYVVDLGRFLSEAKSARNTSKGVLSFLHNYDEPLYDQILRTLPGRYLDAFWIISPFYDAEIGSKRDDPEDSLEYALMNRIFESFKKKSQPLIRFYFQTSSGNSTNLPIDLLKGYKSNIELYERDSTALRGRILHAKMLVFFSHKSSGEPFITIVHGSANFTSAALLSKPPEGNAEVVMVTQMPKAKVAANKLADYLNLNGLFSQVFNWDSFSGKPPSEVSISIVQVWEGLLSIGEKIATIGIYFTVNSSRAKNIQIMLCGEQEVLTLGEAQCTPQEWSQLEFKLPTETLMKIANEAEDILQLLYSTVRIDAFDSEGKLLGSGRGALNVDCPEIFVGNVLALNDRIDLQIYRYGLRALNYDDIKREIGEKFSKSSGNGPPAPKHQADLDLFFRSVHIGFKGLKSQVGHSNSSITLFGQALRKLSVWGARATEDGEGNLTREKRLYLCDRILRTAKELTEIMMKTRNLRKTRKSILRKESPESILRMEFFGSEENICDFAKSLKNDREVGMVAANLLKRWKSLKKLAESDVQ